MNKFLGKDGLTSTSANHIANIAKEMYESIETKMETIRLVSRDYTLAINGQTYRVENESSTDEYNSLFESLKEVSSLKSLIAWLREGIKAKDALNSVEAESLWITEQIKAGKKELESPEYPNAINLKDILSEEPVDRQARYYALEAKCATFGKFIHPDGHLSVARKDYFDKQKNPTSVRGIGQNAEINKYSSTFSSEDVDAEFFKLQQEYRSVQAEFNSLKFSLEEAASQKYCANLARYNDALKAWKSARESALLARNAEIKALKIIIPDSLKDVYSKVAVVANGR